MLHTEPSPEFHHDKTGQKLEAEKSTIVFIFWFYIISRVHKRYECATAYPRVYNYVISATCR